MSACRAMADPWMEQYKAIAVKAAELQCPMRFKRLTRLHKDIKRDLWELLEEDTKAGLKKIGERYTGPVRYH